MKLKAGFIGLGRMGLTHFSLLKTHPLVENVAVCDQSKTMLNILRKYIDVEVYSNFEEMITRSNLDFVVISTPTDSHSKIIRYAVENDLHIFSEKPFSLNPADGKQILEKMKDKKIVNQVGYVNRFNEVFVEVKKIIEEGVLGEIKNFSAEMHGATVLKDTKSSWRGKKNSGGGCMYEFASHCIDLVVYLFGRPNRVAGSILQSIYSSDVEDMVCSNFLYDSGIIGNIFVNWSDASYRKPTNVIKIFGKNGKIIADKHAYKVYLKRPDPSRGFETGWNTRYITDFGKSVRYYIRGNEFTNQLDYFVDSIQMGRGITVCGFAEAYLTDEIIDEIKQDAIKTSKNKTNNEQLLERFQKKDTTSSILERVKKFF